MKTKITLIIAILFLGFTTNAQSKVGTVDSDLILTKMPQLKTVQTRITNYSMRLDSVNKTKINAYDAKVKLFNDGAKSFSETVKKTKLAELSALNKDIAKFRQNGSKMMQIRRDEYLRPLYRKISELIAQVAKEKGYTQILTLSGNEFAYIDEKFDITILVLDKLGLDK